MTRSNDATRPVHRCEEWPDSDCALLDGWPTFPNARFYPSRTPEGAPSFAARLAFGFSAARKGWANNHSPIFTGPISPFQGCGLFFEGLCPSRLCSNGNSSRKRSPARSKSKLSLREWWPGTESNQPDDKPFQGCGLFFKGLRPPRAQQIQVVFGGMVARDGIEPARRQAFSGLRAFLRGATPLALARTEHFSPALTLSAADVGCHGKDGGQGRNRTADASLFRAALYQLSYLARIVCCPRKFGWAWRKTRSCMKLLNYSNLAGFPQTPPHESATL